MHVLREYERLQLETTSACGGGLVVRGHPAREWSLIPILLPHTPHQPMTAISLSRTRRFRRAMMERDRWSFRHRSCVCGWRRCRSGRNARAWVQDDLLLRKKRASARSNHTRADIVYGFNRNQRPTNSSRPKPAVDPTRPAACELVSPASTEQYLHPIRWTCSQFPSGNSGRHTC